MKLNLKIKLILSFTVLIIMTGAITSIVGTLMINRGILKEVQGKVYADLYSAREILDRKLKDIRTIIEFTSIRDAVKKSIINKDRQALMMYLLEAMEISNFEILSVTDNKGSVILRCRNPEVYGDDLSHDRLVKRVLTDKTAISSPVIVSGEDLEKEGKEFADRSRVEIIPAPGAENRGDAVETSGMMLKAAAPVFDDTGRLIGIIYGGDLINGNYSIVDKIKDTVYKGEVYKNKDMGSATLFQNDLRISTNVLTENGQRAIGTRVSKAVHDSVLKGGKQWIDRAIVVDSWYITAYEPLRNIDGKIIGMLYVGMLEDKYVDFKQQSLIIYFAVTFIGMLLAIILSNFFANSITKPIKHLADISRHISDGDFSVKANIKAGDEIGELVNAFNKMARGLMERDEKLRDETSRQLMRSEKLAALGRMAAGIAHEINNPLTGTLMYGHFLLKRLPEGSQDREDAKIIVDETTRCRKLIRNLLDFSREIPPRKGLAHIDDIMEKTINIIKNQTYFKEVDIIRKSSGDIPEFMMDQDQIQQVLINLLLNAAEAMPGGGDLVIETSHDKIDCNIIINITDTGPGISQENLDRIFDPFFTTKETGKGTGLGLAVSYGIIKRHGGRINVKSAAGKGTTFKVTLPVDSDADTVNINSKAEERRYI